MSLMLMCIRRARETIEDVCLNITTESTMNYVNQMAPHATTAEITYTVLHYDSSIPKYGQVNTIV